MARVLIIDFFEVIKVKNSNWKLRIQGYEQIEENIEAIFEWKQNERGRTFKVLSILIFPYLFNLKREEVYT